LPILIYLSGYLLFGAGYIAYMTFMIAYIRDTGGSAAAQALFWGLIGASAFTSPWIWRNVLARDNGGISSAIILGVNTIGAALPLLGHSWPWLTASALIFGVSFFAVVGSTTSFVRLNYAPATWPTAIAAMTIAFGIGQTVGPFLTGALTDALGNLSWALVAGAVMLAAGVFGHRLKGVPERFQERVVLIGSVEVSANVLAHDLREVALDTGLVHQGRYEKDGNGEQADREWCAWVSQAAKPLQKRIATKYL